MTVYIIHISFYLKSFEAIYTYTRMLQLHLNVIEAIGERRQA